jgi:hypothetical protein
MTQKPFVLYKGKATDGEVKLNFLNIMKLDLEQLEKGVVTYSDDNFTIGGHEFRYENMQTLSLIDMPMSRKLPNASFWRSLKGIQIKCNDGQEFVLISAQGASDTFNGMTKRTEELFPHLNEVWSKRLVQGAMDQLRKMLKVSNRIKMDLMQRALGIDADTFSKKIFDWAADFGFKIDGDSVIIEGGDVNAFIAKLDAEFADWGTNKGKKV